MASSKYKIIIYSTNVDLSFNQGKTEYVDVTVLDGKSKISVKTGSTSNKCTVEDLNYSKEMYSPGKVEFYVKITDLASGIDPRSFFEKCRVDLSYDGSTICKGYYVFDIQKLYKPDDNGYNLFIRAYSPDIFLTLDRFNKAHTGKRLGADIAASFLGGSTSATDAVAKFKEGICDSASNATLNLNYNFNHLKYFMEDGETVQEPIIPYCVQYDESFWDFLVRMSNISGEFIYYEDNKFHIGLPSNGVVSLERNKVKQIVFNINGHSFGDSYAGSSVSMPDYMKNIEGVEENVLPSTGGMMSEEFLDPIDVEADYCELFNDYIPPLSTTLDFLSSAAQAQTIPDVLERTALKGANTFMSSSIFCGQVNDGYKQKFITSKLMTDEWKKVHVDSAKKKSYEFASYRKLLDNKFYDEILSAEESVEQEKISFDIVNYSNLPLGQIFHFDGENSNYVLYSICGRSVKNNKDYSESHNAVALPSYNNKYYPLPLRERRVRKSSPQRAIVMDTFDPKRLGRVRVRMVWQNPKTNDFTPWLRVVTPMSTSGGGFMFVPALGDEVLIDFEEGNVSRPFVTGYVYSEKRKPGAPALTHTRSVNKTITSSNGHHLTFTDLPGDMRMIWNSLPFLSLIPRTGNVTGEIELPGDFHNHLSGGFEIADYLGFYSIKGSTDTRSVSISSPFGSVTVNAFTGITINAPLGDVNIVGKNVNIQARNNLNIVSGVNIKNPLFPSLSDSHVDNLKAFAKGFGQSSLNVASSFLSLNLSLYRHMWEVLFRPIGGTMRIKSHRHLCLEAGEGINPFFKQHGSFLGKAAATFWLGEKRQLIPHDGRKDFDRLKKRLYKELAELKSQCLSFNSLFSACNSLNAAIDKFDELKNTFERESEIISKIEVDKRRGRYEINVESTIDDDYARAQLATQVSRIVSTALPDVVSLITSVEQYSRARYDVLSSLNNRKYDIARFTIEPYNASKKRFVKVVIGGDRIDKEAYKAMIYEILKKYSKLNDYMADIIRSLPTYVKDSYYEFMPGIKYFGVRSKDYFLSKLPNKLNLGLKGAMDDNFWTTADKGRIYFSDKKGMNSYIAEDGSLKTTSEYDFVINIMKFFSNVGGL